MTLPVANDGMTPENWLTACVNTIETALTYVRADIERLHKRVSGLEAAREPITATGPSEPTRDPQQERIDALERELGSVREQLRVAEEKLASQMVGVSEYDADHLLVGWATWRGIHAELEKAKDAAEDERKNAEYQRAKRIEEETRLTEVAQHWKDKAEANQAAADTLERLRAGLVVQFQAGEEYRLVRTTSTFGKLHDALAKATTERDAAQVSLAAVRADAAKHKEACDATVAEFREAIRANQVAADTLERLKKGEQLTVECEDGPNALVATSYLEEKTRAMDGLKDERDALAAKVAETEERLRIQTQATIDVERGRESYKEERDELARRLADSEAKRVAAEGVDNHILEERLKMQKAELDAECQHTRFLIEEVDRLRRRMPELERDAERWRWVSNNLVAAGWHDEIMVWELRLRNCTPHELLTHVDAAIAAEKEAKQ